MDIKFGTTPHPMTKPAAITVVKTLHKPKTVHPGVKLRKHPNVADMFAVECMIGNTIFHSPVYDWVE